MLHINQTHFMDLIHIFQTVYVKGTKRRYMSHVGSPLFCLTKSVSTCNFQTDTVLIPQTMRNFIKNISSITYSHISFVIKSTRKLYCNSEIFN